MTMTRKEALELCIDVFTEYLPPLKKAVKAETAEILLQELEDSGALDLEEEEDSSEETDDLS